MACSDRRVRGLVNDVKSLAKDAKDDFSKREIKMALVMMAIASGGESRPLMFRAEGIQ